MKTIFKASSSFFLLFLLLPTVLFAQKYTVDAQTKKMYQHDIKTRTAKAYFERMDLGENYTIENVETYLKKIIPNLNHPSNFLALKNTQETPIGQYYTFQQMYQDVPIYSTQIRVGINKKGTIFTITENSYDLQPIEGLDLKSAAKQNNLRKITSDYLSKNKLKTTGASSHCIFFENAETPLLLTNISAMDEKTAAIFGQHLVDDKGNLIFWRDMRRFHGKKAAKKATNQKKETSLLKNDIPPQLKAVKAEALVFMPDPITSAGVSYGQNGNYVDSNDADRTELNNERVVVEIDVNFRNGRYRLENDFVVIDDFSPPSIAPVAESQPTFFYTRAQSGFEDANTYYHINSFRAFVNSLDLKGRSFGDLVNELIHIDTHALDGDDQSYYTYNSTHQLRFGEGNIDDAEDADVIVHEYAHAVSNTACFDCNFGTEREALDEALADYFATSYSRNINEYNWENMFSWDGHNPFFSGRNVATNKHYPEDLTTFNIHQSSEIFSAPLMEIWGELGRETTEILVLSALYSFGSNISMEAAAKIILAIDQEVCDGENNATLSKFFSKRGLIAYTVDAGDNQAICFGEKVTLGSPNTTPILNVETYWSPGESLNDSTLTNPIAEPNEGTTIYTFNVRDLATDLIISDNVTITTKYCFDYTPTELRLLNTDFFMKGRGNMILEIPDSAEAVEVIVFDAFGRVVFEGQNETNNRLEINTLGLNAGIYFVHVTVDEEEAQVFKVARVR